MDAAPEPAVMQPHPRAGRHESAAGAMEAHDLRTRQAGRLTFLKFHLVVPGSMTVAESHRHLRSHRGDAARRDGAHLVVTIHVEPEAKAKRMACRCCDRACLTT